MFTSQGRVVSGRDKVLSASDLCSEPSVPGAATDGSCELMVSNLDYNISAREWKKILHTEFQHQIQVFTLLRVLLKVLLRYLCY